ncbi:MAG: hypothetical protein LBV23_07285 [Deltaproteobacteria bacterium]|jgi:flagellin-like hook-associated protein FlgL|nr:hypothetical protein [Deltaproteobacteria bacterium]
MIYRTSQRGTYRNINDNLGLLSWRIGQLSNKIASERQINKPSDNPSGAATVLRTRTVLSEITQYTENVNYSNTWLTNTGNVMESVKNALDEIYSKAEQGATDTYTAEQRLIIAEEIDALFQSVVQFADSKYGDNYLFSGQSTDVQPFSLNLKAQQVVPGCLNSELWSGQIQNYGSNLFVPRPDLPIESQKFVIEVVQAGGLDSSLYAHQSSMSVIKTAGSNDLGDYYLRLDSLAQNYNQTSLRLVPGPEIIDRTGQAGTNNEVIFSNPISSPLSIVYAYGNSAMTAPVSASFTSPPDILTLYLKSNGFDPPSLSAATAQNVTAAAIASAVNYTGLVSASVTLGGQGRVDLERLPSGTPINTRVYLSNQTEVEVSSGVITVYLARYSQASGGTLKSTVFDVVSAINHDLVASTMVIASCSGLGSSGAAQTIFSPITMTASDPYTLAFVQTELTGTHNDLIFSVKNEPGAPVGESGNKYNIIYEFINPPNLTTKTTASYSAATSTITVTLGSSGSAFVEEYARALNDPASTAFHSPTEALRQAKIYAITANALEVKEAVEALSSAESLYIEVRTAEGDSGLGKVYPGGPFQFKEGYDQPAIIRVSQDGGLTWGPPTAFNPSQFQTGGLYYNSQLGHASLTTNLPGAANDIVFTANYMGTWGDDLRVEYLKPAGPYPVSASVSVGPQNWNICVTLGVDSKGQITTTANDVIDLINNHPQASQLVTASLANYHEGGGGIVRNMDCLSLTTGEPYEIDGVTKITPLGHATATVSFPYSPPEQACPDLIFQSLNWGEAGNSIGVRYTMSADSSIFGSAAIYQDKVTISYEKDDLDRQVVVVHLATQVLPACPDPESDREAYDQFRKIFPAYSCSEERAVISTAGDVLEALIAKNLAQPDQALVWASMEFKDEGWDSTAKVGPMDKTLWLSGGEETLKASDHGVALKFIPDGTALQVGDLFEVGVGWYNGDSQNLDINTMSQYRTTSNVTGEALLGGNGEEDNVLDTIQRLSWALKHNDSELVGKELPKLKASIEKITTMETNVGTRIIRNEFVLSNLELNKFAAETTLSEIEDADFTKLITDLKNAQLIYEALLGTTGMVTKLSLLNYI